MSYSFAAGDQFEFQVYLQGQNLLDEDIRNSTSTLKDFAPRMRHQRHFRGACIL
ncbi:MAG: hypothetical protein R3E64_17590 [Halioglobus sp.]